MKRVVLIISLAAAFLVGYGGAVMAYPSGGMYERREYYGYFYNDRDFSGLEVLPPTYNNGGRMESMPGSINSATEFINFIKYTQLDIDGNGSSTPRERVGAAFIIQTMISEQDSPNRNNPPTSGQIADWEERVRAAEREGRVSWRTNYRFSINSYYQGNSSNGSPNDDAFFDESGNDPAIIFRDSSNRISYALRWACANPVGDLSPLEKPDNFEMIGGTDATVGGTTGINITVQPGQSITFRHFLDNLGPNQARDIWWATFDHPSNTLIAAGGPNNYNPGPATQVSTQVVNVPLNAPIGQLICRKVGFDPANGDGGRHGRGPAACARVVERFQLEPIVTVDKAVASEGDVVEFDYRVLNPGPTQSVTVWCRVAGIERGPGYTPRGAANETRFSDPGYTAPTTNCPRTFPVNNTTGTQVVSDVERVTIGSQPPGTRICRSLIVDPQNNNGGGPRSSVEVCVVIAKFPLVHFMGGDIWAGGGFAAVTPACNNAANIQTRGRQLEDGSFAGSTVEYGAFALGQITNFGSASQALVSPALGGIKLTFANYNSANLGRFGAPQHCIEDYVARYDASSTVAAGTFNVGSQANGVRRVTGPATFHGTMPNGGQQIYVVDGDVTIGRPGDTTLQYPANYTGLTNIPSLVIIAKGNINVRDSITQMDGVFITRGTFLTCSPKPVALTTSTCAQKLTVNGPVLANKLDLARTFGAGGSSPAQRKEPAEVFNLSTELFLRNALNSNSQPFITETDTRELPPRF